MEENFVGFFSVGIYFEKLGHRAEVWKTTDQRVLWHHPHSLIPVMCISQEPILHSYCTYSPCAELKPTQHKPKRSLYSYQMDLVTDNVEVKQNLNKPSFTWWKSQCLWTLKLISAPSGKIISWITYYLFYKISSCRINGHHPHSDSFSAIMGQR